jgi:hypothetical protein
MIVKYVYVFSTRCSPVVNFKTVPYRNLLNSGNVVVTASAVVYLQYKYIYNIFVLLIVDADTPEVGNIKPKHVVWK